MFRVPKLLYNNLHIYTFLFNFADVMSQERILITGASGFIGSHVAEEALRRGMEVWVAVRSSSDLSYLQDKRLHLLMLDLSSLPQMVEALQGLHLDYVVHAAGVTKALKADTFYSVNTEGTKNLVKALECSIPSLQRFVFVSSLSVFGPIREEMPHRDILDSDSPQPNTAYGRSKLLAEQWLRRECSLPFTIVRPTGVYGPREKDYMLMADSIRKGLDVAVGFTPQTLTFVYVSDVVEAVLNSMKSEKTVGKAYFLSDGSSCSSRDFSDLIIKHLGKRHVLRLVFPLWVLRQVCALSEVKMRLTGKLSTLNNDHYNILRQRNWRCDITPAQRDFGYSPRVNLDQGVRRMLKLHPDPPQGKGE